MTRNRGLAVLLAVVLVAVGVLLVATFSERAAAQQETATGAPDFVMIRCGTGPQFPVKGYQGSAAAPSKRSASCPQVLSDLKKDGFSIRDVGYSLEVDMVVFTLMR
jgi:hypothetical protein